MNAFLLWRSPSLEPPETDVDYEHDEENTAGSKLGVSGTSIQVLGVTAVLLGQAGQVAGF